MQEDILNKPEYSVVREAIELLERKSKDYNRGAISRERYFPHGLLSYHQMLHTKVLRLESLLQKPDSNPNFESIEDTLKDLLNYAIMTLQFIRNEHY